MDTPARLVLEDGTIFRGASFGANTSVFGELVFNTGMTGYQEALTDPSYAGQILMMTYPLIGNYGIHPGVGESDGVKAWGFVVREWCRKPSHRDSTKTIDDFLREYGVPGIAGVDTRALTVKVRERGTLLAMIDPGTDNTDEDLVREVRSRPHPEKENLVAGVSVKEIRELKGTGQSGRVALLDTGVKENIVRNLRQRFKTVYKVPWNARAEDVSNLHPDGIFLSNGPGDPAHPEILKHTVPTLRALAEKYPTQGICLGHQILALSFGLKTFKLKFGHRGANQPVKNLETGRVYITSQNHGFAVDAGSVTDDIVITEVNANDGTVEGLRHKRLPILSSQYHPEACPGPQDTNFLFDRYKAWLDKGATASNVPNIRMDGSGLAARPADARQTGGAP
ncbi:MAG: glutamine-hydrolyzing carbamoyl-phosphate synthase small subunit [Euryarchaeota archaeon]|nr:glutamine-hydrolyzing carbamoyl-phosphate synthase small subunit [Euryarchaeota archaeon]